MRSRIPCCFVSCQTVHRDPMADKETKNMSHGRLGKGLWAWLATASNGYRDLLLHLKICGIAQDFLYFRVAELSVKGKWSSLGLSLGLCDLRVIQLQWRLATDLEKVWMLLLNI